MSDPYLLFVLQKLLWFLILPPASPLIGAFAGIALMRKKKAAGRALTALSLTVLYLLSLDPVSTALVRPLEEDFPPITRLDKRPDAPRLRSGEIHVDGPAGCEKWPPQ